MEIKKNSLVTGQLLFVDHFQSALPIRLYNTKGQTDDKYIFNGGCTFFDHVSGYIQVWHQGKFSANETVKDKLLYKWGAANYGVYIQACHTDNGVFTSKDFMDAFTEKDQDIRFSGAGALIRTALPNVESKQLYKWPAPSWFVLPCAVPRVPSLLNCGPWSLTTRYGCTIKCIARILVFPHIKYGFPPHFFPARIFFPSAILGLLPPTFYNLSFRKGGLVSPNGHLVVVVGSSVVWVSFLTFILGPSALSYTLSLMTCLQPLPPHTKFGLTW